MNLKYCKNAACVSNIWNVSVWIMSYLSWEEMELGVVKNEKKYTVQDRIEKKRWENKKRKK